MFNIENKYAEFETAYNKAIATIKKYESGGKDEYVNMSKYTKWLLSTDINPYSFLEDEYAKMTDTAEGMSCILNTIHHALVDDGEISYIKLDGRPIIRFIHRSEFVGGKRIKRTVIRDEVTNNLKMITEEVDCVVEYLNSFDEFIDAIEEKETKDVRAYFLSDAKRFGFEQSLSHYGKNIRFNKDWIDEVEDWGLKK